MLPGTETWFFSQLDEPQTDSLAHLPHDNGIGPLPTVLKTNQTILMTHIGGRTFDLKVHFIDGVAGLTNAESIAINGVCENGEP